MRMIRANRFARIALRIARATKAGAQGEEIWEGDERRHFQFLESWGAPKSSFWAFSLEVAKRTK